LSAGPDVDQRINGHIFSVDVDEESGNTTSLLNAIAKGQPGKAQLTAVIVFKSDFAPQPMSMGSRTSVLRSNQRLHRHPEFDGTTLCVTGPRNQ
jgi:hypothetical protein